MSAAPYLHTLRSIDPATAPPAQKEVLDRAIKAVGNYGEIFERNVGPKSALKLPRGANNLWSKGGFMYAPPVR